MHEAARKFVERMGLMMEAEGLPRIAGRLYGFLLLHEEAFTLDELADRLQVSKASVSTNARLLEQVGILERITEPGDRRDYYRMGPDAMERSLRTAQRKWRAMQVMFDETSAALPEEMDVGRRRLAEATRFHQLMIDGVERLIEQWREALHTVEAGERG